MVRRRGSHEKSEQQYKAKSLNRVIRTSSVSYISLLLALLKLVTYCRSSCAATSMVVAFSGSDNWDTVWLCQPRRLLE